ncbi:MAG: hypothetical protein E7178_04805 [Erysipelotrichaceae bacterium]|jgi:hypothetical protein|nr:hypothetical protein [Erysipelotrichaceae bacterium]
MERYYLTLDRVDRGIISWKDNYFDIKDKLELIWSDECDIDEANKHFEELIRKQSEQYHVLKTIKTWRIIRLYDKDGAQIAQES